MRKMSFRETREMLLLAYDGKIISDVGEESFQKSLFSAKFVASFDLENIDETECLAEFRV